MKPAPYPCSLHLFPESCPCSLHLVPDNTVLQVEWDSLSSSPSNRLETVVGVEENGRPFIAGDIADTSQAFQTNLGGEEATVEIMDN